jgi:hypothetical protein
MGRSPESAKALILDDFDRATHGITPRQVATMGVLAAAARLRQKDFASRRTWIVYDMTKWMIAVYVGS